MSWSDALRGAALGTALLAAPLALSGCGLHPLYGEQSAGRAVGGELQQVAIDLIPERNGQVLRNLLMDKFYLEGRPAKPDYRLAIQLTSIEENLGIRPDATATRSRVRLNADVQLLSATTGEVLYHTSARSIVSYDILQAQYATLVGQQDAFQRGLTQLSEDIRTRLAIHFEQRRRGRKS